MDTLKRSSVRKSLPLSERDLQDLAKLQTSAAHRAALSRLVDDEVTEGSSEATLLHAVVEAGMRAVQLQVEEHGYGRIADEMDAAKQRATARRRRPIWADE